MRRFLTQFTWIALVCLGVMYALETFYDYEFAKNGLAGIKMNTAYSYDYLVLGDSRASSIRSSVIDSVTGLSGVTVANFGSSLGDLRETLDIFLECGNSAKVLFLSIDPAIGSRNYVAKKFLYVPFKQYLGTSGFHFPFAEYARYNRNFSLQKLSQAISGKWDPMRRLNPDQPFFKRRMVQYVDHSARDFHIEFLIDLRHYCETRGMQLVLFTAPYSPDYRAIQSEFSKYKRKIDSAQLRFFDFSELFDDKQYFTDDVHLRRSSEVLFSLEISKMVESVFQIDSDVLVEPVSH